MRIKSGKSEPSTRRSWRLLSRGRWGSKWPGRVVGSGRLRRPASMVISDWENLMIHNDSRWCARYEQWLRFWSATKPCLAAALTSRTTRRRPRKLECSQGHSSDLAGLAQRLRPFSFLRFYRQRLPECRKPKSKQKPIEALDDVAQLTFFRKRWAPVSKDMSSILIKSIPPHVMYPRKTSLL